MKAKYKVGDVLSINDEYIKQGKLYFGKNLKNKNFVGKVEKVYENTHDDKDGFGDVWQNIYVFKDETSICEKFLKKIM